MNRWAEIKQNIIQNFGTYFTDKLFGYVCELVFFSILFYLVF